MLSREQSNAPSASKLSYFDVHLPGARRTIAARLARAMVEEKCISNRIDEMKVGEIESEGPAQWLLAQAQSGCLNVPHENVQRTAQEIEDGIIGLARAREGLAARWAKQAADHAKKLSQQRQEKQLRFPSLISQLHARSVNLGQSNHLTSALLARFEQLVGEGHPRHPSAKTSLGLGDEWAGVLPEQTETFQCRFVAISEGLVESTGTCLHAALSAELPVLWSELQEECRQRGISLTCDSAFEVPDGSTSKRANNPATALPAEGFRLIPVHPWQLEHIICDEFATEIAEGHLRILETTVTAEPLMSVRTVRIHDSAGSAHLKLALEAQLTGAIRGISHGALVGPELSDLCGEITQLDGSLAPRTIDDAPAFTTCEDLAGVRYNPTRDADAERPRRNHCLGAVLRRDPVTTLTRSQAMTADDVALPVAALQANNPLTGQPILVDILNDLVDRTWDGQLSECSRRAHAQEITVAWFAQLADILIIPVVRFAVRWGIALEPHPQNTVLVLRDGVPHAAIVRDFGGARVLANAPAIALPVPAAARAAEVMRETAIACETVEKLTDKFIYPLLTNLWMGLEETLHAGSSPVVSPHAGSLHPDPSPTGSAPVGSASGISDSSGADIWTYAAQALDRERVRTQFTYSSADEPIRADLAERVFKRIFAPTLPLKRVLAMRLSGAVTEQEYVRIPNPLHDRMDAIANHWHHMYTAELIQASADVNARWQSTCYMEGLDPNCLDPANCAIGDPSTCAQVRLDRDQAVEALAHARCRVRFRLLHLRRLALLRAQSPQHAAALTGGAATGYWDVLRLFPPALRPAIADSLAVEGHTVHPLAKLRRGFTAAESEAYGPENGLPLEMRLVAVNADLLQTSTTGSLEREMHTHFSHHLRIARAELHKTHPDLARRAQIIPVHPWQWQHIIATEFAELIEDGDIALIQSCTIAAHPTISVRTVLPVAPSATGQRPFIKTAMDVILTSTRRSMSQDSALGTPDVAQLVEDLAFRLDRENACEQQVRVVRETAGVAYKGVEAVTRARGLSTLWREDVGSRIEADETALSACVLRGQPPGEVAPLAALIAGHATLRGGTGTVGFIRDYARDLLTMTLPLMWTYGVALESHLQNTMVRVAWADRAGKDDPVEYRGLVLRDFSGLRMYRPRLEAAGLTVPSCPGAVTATDNMREFLDKGHYANVFANLSGMVEAIVEADPAATSAQLWAAVREVLEEVITAFGRANVPDADLEHLLAPALHQKAFASMALDPKGGDRYIDVANPLVR